MSDHRPPSLAATEQGFTLIETAIALVVIGMLLAGGLSVTGTFLRGDAEAETARAMDRIERALVDYAMIHRALPCPTQVPSTGGQPSGRAMPRSVTACPEDQQRGVVPWVTLGLDEDEALDGYGNYITYRVDDESTGVVRTNGLYMVQCYGAADVLMTNGTPTITRNCALREALNEAANEPGGPPVPANYTSTTNFLQGKGMVVRRSATQVLADPAQGTGAAYVLIGHGTDGALAFTSGGTKNGATDATTDEQVNDPAAAWTRAVALRSAEPGAFDDMVRWRTILDLAQAAGLGPAPYNDQVAPPTPPPDDEKPMAATAVKVPTLPSDLQAYIPGLPNVPNNMNTGLNTLDFTGGNFDSGGGNVGVDDDGMGVMLTNHYGGNPAELGRDEALGINFSEKHVYVRLTMALFNGVDSFWLTFYDGETALGRLHLLPHDRSRGGQGAWFLELTLDERPFDRLEWLADHRNTSSFIHGLDVCPTRGDVCSEQPDVPAQNNHQGRWSKDLNWTPPVM